MRGAGDKTTAPLRWPDEGWKPAIAQMQPGAEGDGKPGIAGDDQRNPLCPADSCDLAAELHAVRGTVMAEDDAAERAVPSGARQAGDRRARIGQAGRVGEEEQRGQGCVPAALDRARGAEQGPVHDDGQFSGTGRNGARA